MVAEVNPTRIGNATLYLGHALDILPSIETSGSVIVTDPPYSSGGFNEVGKAAGSIGTTAGVTGKVKQIEGDTMSSEGYVALIRRTLSASRSCAAYVCTDWRMWGHTKEAMELAAFRMRGMLVWDKGHAGMGVRWKMQHELIAWGARVTSQIGAGHGNVISVPRSGNRHHPTEKPLGLMSTIIRNAEPGVVIDPFMGSGSTGVAAVQSGRPFIGVEISREHFDVACGRIAAAHAQGTLFNEQDHAEQVGMDLNSAAA